MTLAILLALGVPDGSKYLIKHGLIEASLEHATETGAFDIAFEVATQNMISKLPEVHLKHALFLEDNEKFEEAEKEFIAACKPKEAIEMYMHIEDWPNALRVAENYDPPSIPDIHAQQGKLLIELKKYSNAEEHFLIASQPELALEMYKDVGMFNDAMRIAQMHLPHKIPEVTAAIQSGQFKGSKQTISKSTDIVALGKSYEQSRRWAEAIDLYMTNGENDNMLYERAIEIARSNLPNKVMEISVEVSRRLVKNRKEEQAANILFEVGRFDDAITICLTAKKFDKAKELAKGNSTLSRRVKEAYENYLADKGDAASLVDNGRVDVALDVLASNGEWDKLWDIVNRGSISTVVIGKFVMMRINEVSQSICIF
jgi:intraflagellar transport protein 172